jgi:hypothetical protein
VDKGGLQWLKWARKSNFKGNFNIKLIKKVKKSREVFSCCETCKILLAGSLNHAGDYSGDKVEKLGFGNRNIFNEIEIDSFAFFGAI